MNKKLWIIIGVTIFLLISVALYASINNKHNDTMMVSENPEQQLNDDAMMAQDKNGLSEKNEADMKSSEDMMMKIGSYESYSPEKIALKGSTGNIVLFFRASWCPTCRALDGDIKSHLKDIPNNLTILDVDYDNSNNLKQKYGVTVQHTLVEVDQDGNLIKKWTGSPTLASLITQIK